MTATDLIEIWDCQKVGLRRCGCGSAVVLRYEPGCTSVYCLRERKDVFGLPDWSPVEVHKSWNDTKK